MSHLTDTAFKEQPIAALYALAFSGWNNGVFTYGELCDEARKRGSVLNKDTVAEHVSRWYEDGLLDKSARGDDTYEISRRHREDMGKMLQKVQCGIL